MRLLLGKPCRRKGGRTKAVACEPVQAWPRERGATGADVGATAGAVRAVAGAGVAAAASASGGRRRWAQHELERQHRLEEGRRTKQDRAGTVWRHVVSIGPGTTTPPRARRTPATADDGATDCRRSNPANRSTRRARGMFFSKAK